MSWLRVAAADQIGEGRGIVVNRGILSLAVFRHQGGYYALDNDCPHQHGPLGLGRIEDDHVVCPLHEWKFHIRTGQMPLVPGICVRTYPTQARADGIYVEIPD